MRRSIRVGVRARAPSAAEAAARRRPVNRRDPASAGVAEPRVHPRPMGRGLLCCVAFAALLAPLRPARAQVIGEAVELERAGRQARAAVVYMAVLRGEPTNLAALLGLERVLPPLGRLPELLPLVRRALAADSTNRVFRALEVRTLATLNDPDSAADAARRWIALAPGGGGADCGGGLPPAGARPLRGGAGGVLARDRGAGGGAGGGRGGRRVRALALARLADAVAQPAAPRARADAARALLDAGDFAAARAVLERLAADSTAPADAQALATSALVEALIRQGDLDAATARLAAAGDRVPADDRAGLRRALVRARIRRGELARADSALAGDSSVDAAALRGWLALYRGDLKAAADQFRAAGPYAGERSDATERSAMLALMQQVQRDHFPELGDALLTLARGDSTRAVQALRLAAVQLQTDGGGGGGSGGGAAELLLPAGRIAARPSGGPHEQRAAAALFAEVGRTAGAGGAGAAATAAGPRR